MTKKISTTAENPNIKVPASISKQVFTGFLNDIFSSCVLKNAPKDTTICIKLETKSLIRKAKPYYMLALKWNKRRINIEAISHDFSVLKSKPEEETTSEEPICKGAELVIGLATAMYIKGDFLPQSSNIPVSMFDGYVSTEICKKGLWAYMSMPKLLLDAKNTDNKDELAKTKLRRTKIKRIAEGSLHIIDSAMIVSILWCIHKLKFTESYKELSKILFDEFMGQKNDLKTIIQFLLLANDMQIISAKDAVEQLTLRLDKLPLAQLLEPSDMVGIVTIFQRDGYINTDLTRRVIILLVEIIPSLSSELCVTLLWALSRSNYDFIRDENLKHILLQRLYVLFESMQLHRSLDMLFNSLALLNVDCTAFFAAAFNKILRLLHILGTTEIINIGCAYAIAAEKRQMLEGKKTNRSSREGLGQENITVIFFDDNKGLHSCLRRKVVREFFDYRPWHTMLLHTLMSIMDKKGSILLKRFVGMMLGHEDACHNGKINNSANMSNPSEIESYLTHTVREPLATNSQRLFYFNILEDCLNQFESLDFDTLTKILYSLLALNVDITSIYQEMLVVKGDAIRKKRNETALKMIKKDDIEAKKSQLRMIWSILHYKQKSNEMTDSLLVDGSVINIYDIFYGLESKSEVETRNGKDVQVPVTGNKVETVNVEAVVQELKKELGKRNELYIVENKPLEGSAATPKPEVEKVASVANKNDNSELEHLLSVAQNLLETINNIKGGMKSNDSVDHGCMRPSNLDVKTAARPQLQVESTNIQAINVVEGEEAAELSQHVIVAPADIDKWASKNNNKKYPDGNQGTNGLNDTNGRTVPIVGKVPSSDNCVKPKDDTSNVSQVKSIDYLRDNYVREVRANVYASGSFEEIPGYYFKIKRFSSFKAMLVKWDGQI